MTIYLGNRRAEDTLTHFHTRPLIASFGRRRHVVAPVDARFVLSELARLPKERWPQAESARRRIVVGLTRGFPITFDDEEQRMLLRAVEGVRARRALSQGLQRLHGELVRGTVG